MTRENGRGRPRQDGPTTPATKFSPSVTDRAGHVQHPDGSPRVVECDVNGEPARVVLDHPGYDFDDVQTAYAAGLETGLTSRSDLQAQVEQRAYELLHARSLEMLGMAQSAAQQKGPAWAAMLQAAADVPWGGDD